MTKEHKLALILGFSLVLIVGVLISDHFSRARTERLGPAVAIDAAAASDPAPLVRAADERQPDSKAAAAWVKSPLPPVTEIVMGESATPETVLNGSAASDAGPTDPTLSDMFEPVNRAASTGAVGGGATPGADPTAARPAAVPTTVYHTVAPDENLWRIAEKYYGDGSKWKRIREHNPTLVDADGEVQVGARLIIPTDVDALKKPSVVPPAHESSNRPAAGAKPDRTYTIQRGDSLGEIAQKQLGSARRWREIYKLNQSIIDDPDDVPAGVTIKLPPS